MKNKGMSIVDFETFGLSPENSLYYTRPMGVGRLSYSIIGMIDIIFVTMMGFKRLGTNGFPIFALFGMVGGMNSVKDPIKIFFRLV